MAEAAIPEIEGIFKMIEVAGAPTPPYPDDSNFSSALEMVQRLEVGMDDERVLAEAIRDIIRHASVCDTKKYIDLIEGIIQRHPPVGPKIKIMRKIVHQERRRIASAEAVVKSDMDYERDRKEAWRQYSEWISAPESPFQMQRPEASSVTAFLRDVERGLVFGAKGVPRGDLVKHTISCINDSSKFVLEHDWAAAFRNAVDYSDGGFSLPDEACLFELRMDGHSIVCAAHTDRSRLFLTPFVRVRIGWCVQGTFAGDEHGTVQGWTSEDWRVCTEPGGGSFFSIHSDKRDWRFANVLFQQIRAAAIALEANIAEASAPIRADYRRNAPSAARNAPTGYSYHVISLARRSRAAALPRDPGAEPSRHVRMHFRRGHWRHYEDHKTWIKWMLCGDPDLGFVDKHYRL